MKKILLLALLIAVAGGCTIKKESGSWNVKKTIIDDVKDSVDETKNLATDLNDANSDLSGKKNGESTITQEGTSDAVAPAASRAATSAEKSPTNASASTAGSAKKAKKSKKKN